MTPEEEEDLNDAVDQHVLMVVVRCLLALSPERGRIRQMAEAQLAMDQAMMLAQPGAEHGSRLPAERVREVLDQLLPPSSGGPTERG